MRKSSLEIAQDLLREAMAANKRAMEMLGSFHPRLSPKENERLLQSSIMAARSYAEESLEHFNAALEVLYREGL